MAQEEALQVFLAHLQSAQHQIEVKESWKELAGPAQKLIVELAGIPM